MATMILLLIQGILIPHHFYGGKNMVEKMPCSKPYPLKFRSIYIGHPEYRVRII